MNPFTEQSRYIVVGNLRRERGKYTCTIGTGVAQCPYLLLAWKYIHWWQGLLQQSRLSFEWRFYIADEHPTLL